MVKRKQYRYKGGKIIDTEEYHDGRYGAPGQSRERKKKPTKEQMQKVNAWNKAKRCRQRLLEYFSTNDCFATWTYRPENRPLTMEDALKDFQKAIGKVRREYRKRGQELYWIRNIEKGTRGAWHIHLIVNEIGETASILQRAWTKGGIWVTAIKDGKYQDDDFASLANYMTKDEHSTEEKKDGTRSKLRISESNYNTSRNMPLPEPEVDTLIRWKAEPKPKKGYYISQIHEGINPVTGYKYRRYTMIRLTEGDST